MATFTNNNNNIGLFGPPPLVPSVWRFSFQVADKCRKRVLSPTEISLVNAHNKGLKGCTVNPGTISEFKDRRDVKLFTNHAEQGIRMSISSCFQRGGRVSLFWQQQKQCSCFVPECSVKMYPECQMQLMQKVTKRSENNQGYRCVGTRAKPCENITTLFNPISL